MLRGIITAELLSKNSQASVYDTIASLSFNRSAIDHRNTLYSALFDHLAEHSDGNEGTLSVFTLVRQAATEIEDYITVEKALNLLDPRSANSSESSYRVYVIRLAADLRIIGKQFFNTRGMSDGRAHLAIPTEDLAGRLKGSNLKIWQVIEGPSTANLQL